MIHSAFCSSLSLICFLHSSFFMASGHFAYVTSMQIFGILLSHVLSFSALFLSLLKLCMNLANVVKNISTAFQKSEGKNQSNANWHRTPAAAFVPLCLVFTLTVTSIRTCCQKRKSGHHTCNKTKPSCGKRMSKNNQSSLLPRGTCLNYSCWMNSQQNMAVFSCPDLNFVTRKLFNNTVQETANWAFWALYGINTCSAHFLCFLASRFALNSSVALQSVEQEFRAAVGCRRCLGKGVNLQMPQREDFLGFTMYSRIINLSALPGGLHRGEYFPSAHRITKRHPAQCLPWSGTIIAFDAIFTNSLEDLENSKMWSMCTTDWQDEPWGKMQWQIAI